PPPSRLLPYTTLFRSDRRRVRVRAVQQDLHPGAARVQPLTEVGRDLDANARGPAVERAQQVAGPVGRARDTEPAGGGECVHERRSEEHTSELQSRENL